MSGGEDKLRVDVWLWRARFVKTRSAAAALVAEGGVRLVRGETSRPLDKPSTAVGRGDVLAFRQRGGFRMVRVEGLGERRGPAAEARTLYADISGSLDGPASAGHVSGAKDEAGE